MSRVRVHQANEAAADAVFRDIGEVRAAIGRRAFELFQRRGCAPGYEMEDWLEAERELFYVPPAEVDERESGFRLTMSAPGFEAEDIHVIVWQREVLVEGKTERMPETRRDNMRADHLESRTLYRHFDLPAPIETDAVTARVDQGSLAIEAPKHRAQKPSVRAAAA